MWRKVHTEWRIAVVCSGFLVGVLLAPVMPVSAAWGIGAFILCVLLFLCNYFYVTAILLVGAGVVGLSYGALAFGWSYGAYAHVIGKEVTVSGVVREDPSSGGAGYYSLQLRSVHIRGSPHDGGGIVFVRLRSTDPILRSDKVTVRGVAEAGFGNFSLSVKNAQSVAIDRQSMADPGRVFRDWFADKVRVLLKEPQASLGIGYLTGQKSALPADLADALKIAGLTHIVVASGYNLTVLVRLARRLLLPVSKFSAAMAALGMVVLFMLITGLSPSMTRAGIVSGLSIVFWYYGRKVHPLVLLLFVAALTVLYQPGYLWGDLGWQLSFSAFFGVMIVGPLLQRYFFGSRPPGIIRQTLGETLAAHIVTVPIIALQFGVVSNVAVVANLLVVPLVPLAMLLTFICGIWSILGLGFSEIFSIPTNALLEYMVGVAQYVAELKWAQSEVQWPASVWVGYSICVLILCWWMWRASGMSLRTGDPLNPSR